MKMYVRDGGLDPNNGTNNMVVEIRRHTESCVQQTTECNRLLEYISEHQKNHRCCNITGT